MTAHAPLPYRIVRNLVVGFSKLYFRATYEGLDLVPAGAFILSPIHRSNVDTLVAAGVTRRRMCFVGKAAMWKYLHRSILQRDGRHQSGAGHDRS